MFVTNFVAANNFRIVETICPNVCVRVFVCVCLCVCVCVHLKTMFQYIFFRNVYLILDVFIKANIYYSDLVPKILGRSVFIVQCVPKPIIAFGSNLKSIILMSDAFNIRFAFWRGGADFRSQILLRSQVE